ncbi:MAG: biotin transporter BioY [Armatimonadetes bacterium]|nr:biotin transporter BioY [Armatimonadota bacterium]
MQVLSQTGFRELTGRRAVAASIIGAAFTAVCAQVAFYLPENPYVPITMQTFAVVLCAMMLGSRLGALSQLEYLAAGMLGAPVFAGFKPGPAAVAGPTLGYLVGFVAAAYVVGLFIESTRRTLASGLIAGLLGVAVIYTFGLAWLTIWGRAIFPGWASWMAGAAPFVGLDAVKVTLAAMLCFGRLRKTPAVE